MPHHPNRLLKLEGASNFRDLGGYRGQGGRTLRWRRLFRSDHLGGLTAADRAVLAGLGLDTAVDFRGEAERAAAPYTLHGVRVLPLGIEPTVVQRMETLASQGHPRNAALAVEAMCDLYIRLVDHQQAVYARLFALLLQAEAPLVFHCTAGKDRTGLAAALILLALGVERELVMQDFLLTNHHYRHPPGAPSTMPAEVLKTLWSVQEAFLDTALDRIERHHGGLQRYLAERLGVDRAAQRALADRFLE